MTLALCNITTALFVLEHCCGLEIALECLAFWIVISLVAHLNVLRNYIKPKDDSDDDCE
jgi:hypothetical protein